MKSRHGVALLLFGVLTFTAACSGGDAPATTAASASPNVSQATSSQPSISATDEGRSTGADPGDPESFNATVNLSKYPGCKNPLKDPEKRCWLPTQFGPRLVPKQSVSLGGQWPLDGDTVRVFCIVTNSGKYRDTEGDVYTWYAILIPEEKLAPGAKARAIQGYDRGAMYCLGYVGISWIANPTATTPPECDG